MEPLQAGAVELRQGALGAQEGDHDELLTGKVVERMLLASDVFEREPGNGRAGRTDKSHWRQRPEDRGGDRHIGPRHSPPHDRFLPRA